ncbi:MAG: SDR family oxidoreductase [Vicinamibacterales bacterium]
MDRARVALVAGATGVIGRAISARLVEDGWSVVCASRSGNDAIPGARCVAVDFLDGHDCVDKLSVAGPFTHVFYAAYLLAGNRSEEVEPNRAMLVNVVNAVAGSSPTLHKVVLVTGSKFYGIHLGASKTPAKETDPRQLPPNFYYDQEDFLRATQKGTSWSWCNLIPPFVTGFAIGNPMNLVMAIGAYCALTKELGLPLRFPGTLRAFDALNQIADARQIASAAAWAAMDSAADNEAFNVANGDPSRWRNLWPPIATHFGLEPADPKAIPLPDLMASNEPLWQRIVERNDLRPSRLTGLVNWSWANYMLTMEHDVVLEIGKIRRAGFHDCIDTESTFVERLRELQTQRLLPT